MLKGFYLTLMVGPMVPIPVPQVVLDALTGIEVTTTAAAATPSSFRLTFTLSKRSPLHTIFLLSAGVPLPLVRVIMIATVNGMPEVLMDGIITKQEVSPGADGGPSTLTISGVDIGGVMEKIDFDGFPFPAMPPEARALVILAKYAVFGIVPIVIPCIFTDVPIPIERIPLQKGKDREYLDSMAADVGYTFYITPGPAPGMNLAYWGPEIRVGIPQPALNVDMDAHTNVESLNFSIDHESRTLPIAFIHEPLTKIPIPIPVPDISLLSPPLGLVPPNIHKIEFLHGTAALNAMQTALRGLTKASQSSEAVTGHGTLNVLRYGRVLKARQLVGVRGAGMAFDGLYYVKSVTHNVKRGEYKQSFTLTRNGLISTLPRVPA
jgi:hypothetical protein